MCTVLLPPGDNPIAVNKYININNIKWEQRRLQTIQAAKTWRRDVTDLKTAVSNRFCFMNHKQHSFYGAACAINCLFDTSVFGNDPETAPRKHSSVRIS